LHDPGNGHNPDQYLEKAYDRREPLEPLCHEDDSQRIQRNVTNSQATDK
jgi:hypothetical protein